MKNPDYRYLNGDTHHPCEYKACESCGQKFWLQTRRRFCSYKCSQTGPNNTVWKGDNAKYVALHARVYRRLGKASGCEVCGTKEKRHYEWANLTGHYGDVDDYASMCKPCHWYYDRK